MKFLLSTILLVLIFNSVIVAQQWQNVSPAGYNYFSAASFINDKEGWVIARYGEWPNTHADLIHTTDCAITFTSIFSLPDTSKCFFLQMVDSLNGFAKIDMDWPSDDVLFWATYNGGLSWLDITDTSMFAPDNPLHNSSPFFFLDKLTGFAGSTNAIFRTINGGLSWEKMNTPTFIDSSTSNIYKPNKLFFLDNKYGWASCSMMTDEGFVLKTTDGGQNWIACKPITGDLYNIHFADSLHGGTTGGNWYYSTVILTENNFDTISHFYLNNFPQLADAIYYQNDTTIWMSGYPAVIYKSTDGGASFIEYDTTYATDNQTDWLHDFQFFDSTGYAFAYSFILKMVDTLHTSVNPLVQINDIRITPNPAINNCSISLVSESAGNSVVQLYSVDGVLVLNTERYLHVGKNELLLDISNLKPGMYIIKISNNSNTYSSRLIKQP